MGGKIETLYPGATRGSGMALAIVFGALRKEAPLKTVRVFPLGVRINLLLSEANASAMPSRRPPSARPTRHPAGLGLAHIGRKAALRPDARTSVPKTDTLAGVGGKHGSWEAGRTASSFLASEQHDCRTFTSWKVRLRLSYMRRLRPRLKPGCLMLRQRLLLLLLGST